MRAALVPAAIESIGTTDPPTEAALMVRRARVCNVCAAFESLCIAISNEFLFPILEAALTLLRWEPLQWYCIGSCGGVNLAGGHRYAEENRPNLTEVSRRSDQEAVCGARHRLPETGCALR